MPGEARERRMTKHTQGSVTARTAMRCLAVALLAIVLPAGVRQAAADASLPAFAPTRVLARDATVLTRGSYNYAPAVIRDGESYHLYWCAGVAGDYVLHAEASDLKGPWHGEGRTGFDRAMAPSGSADKFDGTHACDPNVVKIGGRYYLYYGGLPKPDSGLTAVGVAVGDDPVHFTRLDGGRPIVIAAKTNPNWEKSKLTYGAGQPAAVYVAPYVYLAFSDSTGAGANPINGAGQFVLRSKDPSFATGIQEYTGRGWENRAFGQHTAEHSILDSFGIDWAYDAATDTLVTVTDRSAGQATVLALDPRTFRTLATGAVPLDWREGPGLLAQADKSMAPRPECGSMDVAVFAAAGASAADPFSWHGLQYSQEDVAMGGLCARKAR